MTEAWLRAELAYFAAMMLAGWFCAAVYHILLFFRALVRHGTAWTDAEDILFFSGTGLLVFLVAYQRNDGILRWYTFFGGLLGVWCYCKTVGRLLESLRKWLLQKRRKISRIKAKKKRSGETEVEGCIGKSKSEKRKKENGTALHCSRGDGVVRRYRVRKSILTPGKRGKGKAVSGAGGEAFGGAGEK
ncbi:MAG: hypothetical protein E7260_12280 [Lachnospiraceae bacterium]|nr:hypothetical protein [Lachnospiraceae bacterium]